jgi:hypothetical protein
MLDGPLYGWKTTHLALAIQQLHAPAGLCVTDGIVLALFIVGHGVE